MQMIDFTLLMATPPAGEGAPSGGLGQMLVPMILIFGIFYFMLIRPQQRKEKERRAMIEAVKTGSQIVFSGGILGTVTNVKENTLVVRVADGVKIEIARGAVSRVIEKGENPEADESK